MEEVAGPTVFTNASGGAIQELGTRTPTLKFLGGASAKKQFSVCEGLKVNVLSTAELEDTNHRIVHQPAKFGGSYIERLTDKSKPLKPQGEYRKVFRRGNKYQIPVWVRPNGHGQKGGK